MNRRLSEDQIRFVLVNKQISQRKRAAMLGVDQKIIYEILHGHSYLDFCPELPRVHNKKPGALSCDNCVHKINSCTMDFPEYRKLGDKAATKCNTYFPLN